MTVKKFLSSFLLVFCCLGISGGCSLFAPHHEELTVVTIPPGANVDIDGTHHLSPVTTLVRRDHSFPIYVDMAGYVPEKAWCGRTISTTGMLDLAGAMVFYLPAVGFFSPGVWKLEQNYFKFYLKPVAEPRPESSANP